MRAKITTAHYPGGVNAVIETDTGKKISVSKSDDGTYGVAVERVKNNLVTTDANEAAEYIKKILHLEE